MFVRWVFWDSFYVNRVKADGKGSNHPLATLNAKYRLV
jgi:hypothetical protein